jgi:hypothetical protein
MEVLQRKPLLVSVNDAADSASRLGFYMAKWDGAKLPNEESMPLP